MKVPTLILIATILLPNIVRAQDASEDIHIGGGVSFLKLSDIHPSIAADSSPGYNLILGTRDPYFGMDLVFTYGTFRGNGEATPEPYYPASDVSYFATDSIFRIYFRDANTTRVAPWVSLGGGIHFFALEDAYYTTYGYQFVGGAGVDISLNESAYLRLGGQGRYYSTRDYWLGERSSGGAVGLDISVVWIISDTSTGESS